MEFTESVYNKAVEVLKNCSSSRGFLAAYPSYHNLKAIWSRDSMISSLGASLTSDKVLHSGFRNSLNTLSQAQSASGQIPNAVHDKKFNYKKDYATVDSTLWFIIGQYEFASRFKDNSLLNKNKRQIEKAFFWLECQDTGEDGLPEQQPTSDWQDAFPHRYGHTINTQALYYHALTLAGKNKQAKKLKETINCDPDKGLWNGRFYFAYKWKNHNKYPETGDWFDTLGNLLAIVFGLAEDWQAEEILCYIKQNKINQPFPIKCLYPPIKKGSKNWYDYFYDCGADKPYYYLNGGIWPYIGGFYIAALVKMKRFDEAEKQLEKLAEANLQGNGSFWEWLDGKTGLPEKEKTRVCKNQAWSAGAYVYAYKSVQAKKYLI